MNAELPSPRDPVERSDAWYERQKSRERIKLIALLAIAVPVLLIAFWRFGRTIPWGAR